MENFPHKFSSPFLIVNDENFTNIDYQAVYQYRLNLLEEIRKNPSCLPYLKEVYRKDPISFIHDWIMTFDPKTPDPNKRQTPFILFERQRQYIRWLQLKLKKQEGGIVVKPRSVGLTHMNCAFSICLYLFSPMSEIGFMSKDATSVDKLGNRSSILEKIRWMLRFLPGELLPSGFNEDKHLKLMNIVNPENGSTIVGATGDDPLRGGRATILFPDECAHYEHPEQIDSSLEFVSDVIIEVSTHKGMGHFYNKVVSGLHDIFTLQWFEDPRKDKEWFEKKKRKLNSLLFAEQVLCDPCGSLEGALISKQWVDAAVNFDIDDSGKCIAGFDVADEGGDKKALIIRKGMKTYHIEEWLKGTVTEATRVAYGICKDHKVEILNYDNIGPGSGVKGEIKSILELTEDKDYKLTPVGVNVGSRRLPGFWVPGTKNKDMFANLKAKMSFEMRDRFRKTYEHVEEIKEHSHSDLISIPNHAGLIQEICSVIYTRDNSGKIIMEPKKNTKKRLGHSPDKWDALVICYNNPPMTGFYTINN